MVDHTIEMVRFNGYAGRTRTQRKAMARCPHAERKYVILIDGSNMEHLSRMCVTCTSHEFIPWDNALAGRPKAEGSARKRKKIAKAKEPGFFQSREWLALRYATLRKYGRKCQACLSYEGRMHVDHIKPRSKHPELALVASNLQVLCEACNMGKSNKFEDDWRSAPL